MALRIDLMHPEQRVIYIFAGSISLSVLSGKIMFRDVAFVTEDCSFRVQDGWVIFRWWRAYVPKDISEGILGYLSGFN